MRKILFGVVVTLIVLFTFKYCNEKKEDKIILQESSALIQEQIKNVGKLIVTEKKALVVVNAEVTIAYDLSKIEFEVDEANKTLTILNIPEQEIKINPDLEYYDVQADFLNPFEAKDYNDIKSIVNASLERKIENSDFKKNAENRLISELSKFYILTNTLGWTLKYNSTPITKTEALQNLKL